MRLRAGETTYLISLTDDQLLPQHFNLFLQQSVILRNYIDCLDQTSLFGYGLLRFKHHCLQRLLVQLQANFQIFDLANLLIDLHLQGFDAILSLLLLQFIVGYVLGCGTGRCCHLLLVNVVLIEAASVSSRRVRYIVKFANLRLFQVLCAPALSNLLFFTISIN